MTFLLAVPEDPLKCASVPHPHPRVREAASGGKGLCLGGKRPGLKSQQLFLNNSRLTGSRGAVRTRVDFRATSLPAGRDSRSVVSSPGPRENSEGAHHGRAMAGSAAAPTDKVQLPRPPSHPFGPGPMPTTWVRPRPVGKTTPIPIAPPLCSSAPSFWWGRPSTQPRLLAPAHPRSLAPRPHSTGPAWVRRWGWGILAPGGPQAPLEGLKK